MAGENSIFALESSALGKLVSMTLSHDGSGPHPDWRVVSVQVRDVLTDQKTFFHVNRLLSSAWSTDGNGECVTVEASDSLEAPIVAQPRRGKSGVPTADKDSLITPTIAPQSTLGAASPEMESHNTTFIADAGGMRSPIGDTDSVGSNDVFDQSARSNKV